jgi:threonine/homoserine/homoserine lactone efflux protein
VSHLWTFIGISALVIATPGPDTALTVRNSLLGGRRGGVCTALGVCTGQITWALFTSGGVAALLRASQPAFFAVRLAGCAYIVFLGTHALVDAFRNGNRHSSADEYARREMTDSRAYRQGVLSNLGNPKMAVFFISLLPQFTAGRSFTSLMTLGLTFSALTLIWLSAYALAVARARRFLTRERTRRFLDAATGLVLVGFGLRLVSERVP